MKNGKEVQSRTLPPMSRGMRAFSMALFFLLGAALAAFVFGNPLNLTFLPGSGSQTPREATHENHDTADGGTIYQCPMHPEVISDGPADCTICGMDLVEVKGKTAATGTREEADVIEIDPVQVQNIGVVSEPARSASISRTSRTVGILDYNADRITWINTKYQGWIEQVHVSYVGQKVRKGEPLFDIYSPELVTTQEEYLRALDYRDSLMESGREETRRQAESLLRSTRERLAYWDVSEEQVRNLEESREVQRLLTVDSPVDGTVAEVMEQSLEGMFVRPGMDLYKIADLTDVWVHAEVHEKDLAWVREGLPARVSFRHDPERVIHGTTLFLYPELSSDTRTLKICVELPNPGRRLRPGMYAEVVLQGPGIRDAVIIPESSVLRSGERDLVFVDLGEGKFQPRTVKLGIDGEGDDIQVLDGVAPGEYVVTQAQFMLDSESRLREAIAKFMERGRKDEPQSAAHVH